MGKSAKKLWMISIALAMFLATVATVITMSASYAGSGEESSEAQIEGDTETWYVYVYRASNSENGESARMGVISYLRGLGYDGGINVGSSWEGSGSYIVIGLPFELSQESLSTISETLAEYGYEIYDIREDICPKKERI